MRTPVLHALAIAAVTSVATTAHAVQLFNQTVDIFDSVDNDFVPGNGTPTGQFVQDSVLSVGPNTVSVAVRPRDRDTGAPDSLSTNRYVVQPGQSSTNPARPNLAFDYQFDPGTNGGSTNYILRLSLDFNPAYGNSAPGDFTTIELPVFDGDGVPDIAFDSFIDTDGYYLTNETGSFSSKTTHAWNDATVPYVIANTTNHTFLPGSVNFPTYNSNNLGEYEIRFEALDPTGTTVLASATAFAVVPEPTSIALLGLGAVALMRRTRKA